MVLDIVETSMKIVVVAAVIDKLFRTVKNSNNKKKQIIKS